MDEPSLQLLQQSGRVGKLSSYHFTRLINSHINLAQSDYSIQSLQQLADWSGSSQASILYLLLQAASTAKITNHSKPFIHDGTEHQPESQPDQVVTPLTLDHAASHLAVALAIEHILLSIPRHARNRINLIPTEIGARFGLTDEALFRQGPNAPGLIEAVANLVGIARAELATSRGCFEQGKVPTEQLPVFLPGQNAERYFDRLAANEVGFNVFDLRSRRRDWKLPFLLSWNQYRRSF